MTMSNLIYIVCQMAFYLMLMILLYVIPMGIMTDRICLNILLPWSRKVSPAKTQNQASRRRFNLFDHEDKTNTRPSYDALLESYPKMQEQIVNILSNSEVVSTAHVSAVVSSKKVIRNCMVRYKEWKRFLEHRRSNALLLSSWSLPDIANIDSSSSYHNFIVDVICYREFHNISRNSKFDINWG
jgi:hypothetical protein